MSPDVLILAGAGSVNFCRCQEGAWLRWGGYSIPPHIIVHCLEPGWGSGFFLCRKHGGRSRLVLCIGIRGRFLISLMFPVYCCASSSQLHPNVAGNTRGGGSDREQSVVSESLGGGPELGSTVPKSRHLGRAWRELRWGTASIPRLSLKFTRCCKKV